jgi:signal transduction histidine kinase
VTARRLAWPVAVACLVLGLVVALIVLAETQARVDLTDERDARLFATRAVPPVVQALREQRENAALVSGPGSRQVGVDDDGGPSEGVAELARDTGLPVLDEADGGQVVVAQYDPPGPTTVAARRATLAGYRLAPIDLTSVLDDVTGEDGALAIFGPTAELTETDSFDAVTGGDEVLLDVPLDDSIGTGWHVKVATRSGGIPAGAWFGAAIALVAGLAGGLLAARRWARVTDARAAAERRTRSDATLAELASVAQSSLDLAEVLPASFAVMESALDLDGMTLLGAGSRPTFVWRDAPSEAEDVLPLRAPVPAGACVDVSLARTGRSLGVLRVRPGRELDELDVHTLAAAADTLSASIANADAYAHQRNLISRMRALDDLKTVFVATASHELRTPVAAIIGYASMLSESWDELDSETGRLYAQRVDSNAQRLAALVEHLLDFSRLEHPGTDSADKVLLDLGAEVKEVLDFNSDLTPDHTLLTTLEPGLMVAGSRLAIERVVVNLVGNAAKYSPAGTCIRVRVERGGPAGTEAHLIVDDEGPGVPEEEREQIFSRFFRGKGDAVIRTRGAGLGLAIVTEFAASMDGQVSIDSAPTGGTRFEVAYPLTARGGPDEPA